VPFLTVDDIDEPSLCWRVSLPPSLSKVFFGLILEASYTWNWEQFGAATPEECALKFDAILNTDPVIPCEGIPAMPIGSIVSVATEDIPAGLLYCDGSEYDAIDYPDLFAVIATRFKGSDTFTVPDLRNRFVLGFDESTESEFNQEFDVGGEVSVTLTEAMLPSHTHPRNSYGRSEYGVYSGTFIAGDPNKYFTPLTNPSHVQVFPTTGASGGGQPHNNLPPYMQMKQCIVAESLS